MSEKFAFLKSVRFWKLCTIGVLEASVAVGALDGQTLEAIVRIIEAVLAMSVTIRTVDRFAEKTGSVDTSLNNVL